MTLRLRHVAAAFRLIAQRSDGAQPKGETMAAG
jgi:hypothetical protein